MARNRFSPATLVTLLCGTLLLLCPGTARAAPEEECLDGGCPRTSPTAVRQGGLPRGRLEVRSHDVQVVINNGFATTTVDQVLVNPGTRDVEAAWAFPLPVEAALSELSLLAGGERYMGEVVARQEARRIYEAERAQGERAALAEQHDYFHYQVEIARVPAGGEVTARIVYYQALEIEAGVGRYLYPMQEGHTDDLQRAFWSMERRAAGRLRFDVTLKTAFPIDQLHSPSHPGVQFSQAGEEAWRAQVELPDAALDRDFVLLYRLRPDVPARVELLTHRGEGAGEGTFMAVVTPGSDLAPIESGTDWAFVLDVSGSMQGEKIRLLQRGVAKAIQGLDSRDRFQLVTFNQGARRLTPAWQAATPQGQVAAQGLIQGMRAGGSTNVHAGLTTAYALLEGDRPSGIILVSDGVANVGPHAYRDFVELQRRHDVRIFTFAIGNSANVRLLEDLATLSGGTSVGVSARDEIGAHLLLARDRMSHTAMHGVTFALEGATVVHPRTLPTLYMGQQLVVFGRYDRTGPAELVVGARISGKPVSWTLPVNLPAADGANPELERLYALFAIEDLKRESWLRTGDGGEAQGAILDMALRYSLVTDYTSMIVVREQRKSIYGIGDANAKRRAEETAAATRRDKQGNAVRTHTGGTPLAGPQAAHAPSRYAARRQAEGGEAGGGGGSGALGPLYLLAVAGLAAAALRRRRRRTP